MNNAGDVIGTGMMNEGIVRTWQEFFNSYFNQILIKKILKEHFERFERQFIIMG